MPRKLLEEPLMDETFEETGRKGYEVSEKGSYLRLLPAQLAALCVVSPTGFSKEGNSNFCFSIDVLALAA
jgi:hypothetical protein